MPLKTASGCFHVSIAQDAKFKQRQKAMAAQQNRERDERRQARAEGLAKISAEHTTWQSEQRAASSQACPPTSHRENERASGRKTANVKRGNETPV